MPHACRHSTGPIRPKQLRVQAAVRAVLFAENQFCVRPSRSNWSDHSAGISRRLAMPIPRGRRPSMLALTRAGAMNAIEIVMLTWRALHFWRTAISSTVASPEMISSSHARPRAIDLTSAARRSNLIGRTRCRSITAGNRTCLNLLGGGLVHGISREGARSTAASSSASGYCCFSSGVFSQSANVLVRTSILRKHDD